jgi:maltooligosyltrehalose trehalohydrolase
MGEFAEHGWDADAVPDPQDPGTFLRSKLDWREPEREPHRALLEAHRRLLALRKAEPELVDPDLATTAVSWDDDSRWLVASRGSLRVLANLSDEPREIPLDRPATGLVFATGSVLGGDEPALAGLTVTVPAESAAIVRTG